MSLFLKNNGDDRILHLLIGDMLISMVVFLYGYEILGLAPCASATASDQYLSIVVTVGALLFSSFLLDLYRLKSQAPRFHFLLKSLGSVLLASVILAILYTIIPCPDVPWRHMAYAFLVFAIFQNIWHYSYFAILGMPFFARNVLVLGTGPKAVKVENLLSMSTSRYRLTGYVGTSSESVLVPSHKVIGTVKTLVEDAKKLGIDTIVIALSEQRGNMAIDKLLTCKMHGINIVDLPSFYELLTGKLPVEEINPSWLVYSQGFRVTRTIRFMKRLSDLVLAMAGIMVCLPFVPFIALMIKITSSGPVFYSQVRVGENEKQFTIFKFRTMLHDAESETGAAWAQTDDPRITWIGRILRKTRIDELPQLINVLKGDMSFIGPRPERPEFVEKIKEVTSYYGERHCVKPGITGWAQVKYPYGSSFGDSVEKLRYDLYYINNMSFFLDLLIIFETIKVVAFRRYGR